MIGKWLGFVSALWVQAISGNNYTFSNYSVALKAVLGINQVQLNGLSSAKDVGKAFGVLAGLLADSLPPWAILLIGSIDGLVGYGVQWLVISKIIRPLPYWLMCVAMGMGGNSTTWMNTAVLVTCVRNFRGNRGPVAGILKAYVGLSTAIFTDFVAALFTSDPSAFVLTLAVLPAVICTIAMFLLRPIEPVHNPTEAQVEARCFGFLNAVAIVLALYLLGYGLSGIENVVVSKIIGGGLLLILAIPAALPLYLHLKVSKSQDQSAEGTRPLLQGEDRNEPEEKLSVVAEVGNYAAAESLVEEDVEKSFGGEAVESSKKTARLSIGDEHSPTEALQTMYFWLLFACFLCGVGTGMAMLNNLGQIAESLGYSSSATFVSLTSIFGFFGRLGSGQLSEYLIRWGGVPRPAVLAASQVAMAGGFAVLATGCAGSLYVGSIVMGTSYGVRLAVSVPVVSELFGLKSFGLMYNLLILNLPLGSFIFSSLLAGFLYDREAAKESSTTCLGTQCYRVAFIVMATVSAVGFSLDSILALCTRDLYRKIQWTKTAEKQGQST